MDMTTPDAVQALANSKRELSLAQRLALGTRMTELREARMLTQLEVAQQALGFTVSHAAVSRLERGVFRSVDNEKLDKMAGFYGTTVEALLRDMDGRHEDREPESYQPVDGLTCEPGFGNRLFNLRQSAGLTKREMAVRLGYTPASAHLIKDWERETVTPHTDTMLHIAVAFSVSAAWLMTGTRAKPAKPTLAMRLRAIQKMFDLSNRDVALIAGMDMTQGPKDIVRYTRGRNIPPAEKVSAIAEALDVPVIWINPPQDTFEVAPVTSTARLSPNAARFIEELTDMFGNGVLTDKHVASIRHTVMKELMDAMKPRK